MPRTTLYRGQPGKRSWLQQLTDRLAPAAGRRASAASVSCTDCRADDFSFLEECGINVQIAERRQRMLRKLAQLLQRYADADCTFRRGLHERIREMARLRRDSIAACKRLSAPSTIALPASALVLLAHLHAQTPLYIALEASLIERQQQMLAASATAAVAEASNQVLGLQLRLKRLALSTQASHASLLHSASHVNRDLVRERHDEPLPFLVERALPARYVAEDVRTCAAARRIFECLSHLNVAAEMLNCVVRIQGRPHPRRQARLSPNLLTSPMTCVPPRYPMPSSIEKCEAAGHRDNEPLSFPQAMIEEIQVENDDPIPEPNGCTGAMLANTHIQGSKGSKRRSSISGPYSGDGQGHGSFDRGGKVGCNTEPDGILVPYSHSSCAPNAGASALRGPYNRGKRKADPRPCPPPKWARPPAQRAFIVARSA